MPEHSPEPWDALQLHAALGAGVLFNPIIDCGNHVVAEIFCKEPNVLRIVACVNALAGVPDPAKLMSMLRTFVDNYEENYSEMNGEGITEFADIQNAMEGND